MTKAFNGKDFALKIGNGASPEIFSTVAALKTLQYSNQRNTVDITNKDSAGARELLGTAAIASGSISGGGIYSDDSSQALLIALNQSGAFVNLRAYYGSNDYFAGKFVITQFQMSGGFDDAQQFTFTAESSGVITNVQGS